MKEVSSFEEIQYLLNEVRGLKRGFITNFYPDPFRISLWCRYNSLFYVRYTDTVFFLRNRGEFSNLYYCSVNEETLRNSLPVFLKECFQLVLVTDLVGTESVDAGKGIFLDEGFECHTSLVRMSRTGVPVIDEADSLVKIEEATEREIFSISELYDCYFDPYSEQIPLKEELMQWVEAGHLLINREAEKITGFLIYDRIGVTLYLRYWFTHPDYRERKIGSALFREFLYREADTKRQMFWVIGSNENAIKRYIHYGFSQEKMFDYVLIKK